MAALLLFSFREATPKQKANTNSLNSNQKTSTSGELALLHFRVAASYLNNSDACSGFRY